MYDRGKIVTGMIVFGAILAFPFFYNAASGKGSFRPNPVLPAGQKNCIESKEYMKTQHTDMLNTWRDAVVRSGQVNFQASNGQQHVISLTQTCMNCHADKVKFCDECHNYVGASLDCFNCHVDPTGK